MQGLRIAVVSLALLGAAACNKDTATPTTSPPANAAATQAPSIDAEALRPHVSLLAGDALQGRAPGTDGDEQTQAYVERMLTEAGLTGAFDGNFRQPFDVGDGVKATAATELTVGKTEVAHGIVPFSGVAGEAVKGKLIYVGYGLAPDGKGSGDYEEIGKAVAGKIVVARYGSADPHVSPAATRPQQKLINAREHGAVGFIYWEPEAETAYPNHGEWSDLKMPALWVGKEGSSALVSALSRRAKDIEALSVGAKSRATASMVVPIEPVRKSTANVAGVLPGNGKSSRALVIGAHMDHLGLGTSSSLAPDEHAVHNGADDNASGVAVVLELARAMAKVDQANRPFDVIVMAFGAEEMGLLGSKHYVESLGAEAPAGIVAMLNFDMVGRLGDQGLQVAGVGTSSVWPEMVAGASGTLKVTTTDDGYGPSDHSSFYEAGIPVLHFFTGSHADYHKPSDDIDKINFEGAAQVGAMALQIATTLENDAIEPDFIKVARKQTARGGFRVSLGTIPDYGAQVDGVRLSGAREGGPAAEAGLTKGDVITRLADREIHNLDDYMAAFAVLEAGKEIDVEVMRDGTPVTLKMTPAQPQRR